MCFLLASRYCSPFFAEPKSLLRIAKAYSAHPKTVKHGLVNTLLLSFVHALTKCPILLKMLCLAITGQVTSLQ